MPRKGLAPLALLLLLHRYLSYINIENDNLSPRLLNNPLTYLVFFMLLVEVILQVLNLLLTTFGPNIICYVIFWINIWIFRFPLDFQLSICFPLFPDIIVPLLRLYETLYQTSKRSYFYGFKTVINKCFQKTRRCRNNDWRIWTVLSSHVVVFGLKLSFKT